MTENDKTDTSRSISDEELMKNEVIGDDADLYYLDCYLSGQFLERDNFRVNF